MPVELILYNSAGPKSVRVGQVRVGKRRISLLVRTNQNIAFVPEKFYQKAFKGISVTFNSGLKMWQYITHILLKMIAALNNLKVEPIHMGGGK